ncbi:glutamyl-tRNA reductase [Thermobifida cellulosilytica]|uniref:Glutamyl-tRNA reductase n=1 Tax=Thermobifida cellulosilytica TB100 TaxID=665004 RepID=A0A147KLC1_THECS|nr:glutamyl-tRNA reductase [Thermobifida cellulosilytica]KUP98102.1 glutamyl-tRNA reductase [Thermobifida cellulosilytica TB100]
MSVLALGVSHRSAPVALLERVALSGETRLKLMTEMTATSAVNEVMMVSTCNRTEVYADVDQFHPAVAAICDLLSQYTGVSQDELTRHCYVHYEERAVQHLFSVTCGLDSMVVGEGQILGQVRNALKDAQYVGTLGRVLNDLGQRALRVGKRAHTETRLDRAGADMVSFGLSVAGRHLPTAAASATATPSAACPVGDVAEEVSAALPDPQPLTGLRVMVLGAGSMSALSANTIARRGASTVLVANRTPERAERLAECLAEGYDSVHSRAVPFEEAAAHLDEVDLVVSCTGAQGVVLTAEQVAAAVGDRTSRPLVFLDLALPHDIDKAVRDLPGVYLVGIEDLRSAVAEEDATGVQAADLTAVREIVAEEVAEYQAVRSAERVAPTVVALRSKARSVMESELERLHGRLPDIDDRTRAEITRTVRRVVDKLLHQPTVRVKQLATGPGGAAYAEALRELFDLDPAIPDAVVTPGAASGEERRR